MSPAILESFNNFTEQKCTREEAYAYIRRFAADLIPDEVASDDWRAHVPMPILEQWETLSDKERLCIFVMAMSAALSCKVLEEQAPVPERKVESTN